MANIEHIQYINAPVEKVYEVLTTESGLAEVWTQELTFAAQLGAVNEFKFGDEAPTKMKMIRTNNSGHFTKHCFSIQNSLG